MSRVLIIDDDSMIRRMAGMICKKLGAESAAAESGEAGVAELASGSYDLVLLDVEMPVTDGFETLAKIRELPSAGDTPVCLMTGTLTDEVRQRAEQLGAVCCIPKPLRPADVSEALAKAGR